MRAFRYIFSVLFFLGALFLGGPLQFCRNGFISPVSILQESSPFRNLFNKEEVFNPVFKDPVDAGNISQWLLSFEGFMEEALYNPDWGYYATHADIGTHFNTFPEVLPDYMGAILAENAFKMWKGMLRAQTINEEETFIVAEFGAGNGGLANSFAAYVLETAKSEPLWQLFQQRVRYKIFEKSLRQYERQYRKTEKYGSLIQVENLDAEDIGLLSPFKGMIFSNELIDVVSAEKVVFRTNGEVYKAFVLPCLNKRSFEKLKKILDRDTAYRTDKILKAHEQIMQLLELEESDLIYLDPRSFNFLMGILQRLKEAFPFNADKLDSVVKFNEIYIPVKKADPQLWTYIRLNFKEYQKGLSMLKKDAVFYLSHKAKKFIRGAGNVLTAGYVVTIDYGHCTYGLFQVVKHHYPNFRILNNQDDHARSLRIHDRFSRNPYEKLGKMDLTLDIDFTQLSLQGESVDLKVVYFGHQGALARILPGDAAKMGASNMIDAFRQTNTFQVLVQQKRGTDPEFVFSNEPGLKLYYSPADKSL